MTSDRIEKSIHLRAPIQRVWNAITDAKQFGAWFGARFEEPFVAGAELRGKIAATTVDPEVAKLQEPHVGSPLEITIVEISPMNRFSFRWHPYAVDREGDYTQEPTTLVTFRLEPDGDGTLLTVTETGFDQIPLARRAEAFESN